MHRYLLRWLENDRNAWLVTCFGIALMIYIYLM